MTREQQQLALEWLNEEHKGIVYDIEEQRDDVGKSERRLRLNKDSPHAPGLKRHIEELRAVLRWYQEKRDMIEELQTLVSTSWNEEEA